MNKKIETIDDLIELLGEEKVNELFLQNYIRLTEGKVHISDELKELDLLNVEED